MKDCKLKLVHSNEDPKIEDLGCLVINTEGATLTEALLGEAYRRMVGNPRLMYDKKKNEWVEMGVVKEKD